jgi:hypothetical protein
MLPCIKQAQPLSSGHTSTNLPLRIHAVRCVIVHASVGVLDIVTPDPQGPTAQCIPWVCSSILVPFRYMCNVVSRHIRVGKDKWRSNHHGWALAVADSGSQGKGTPLLKSRMAQPQWPTRCASWMNLHICAAAHAYLVWHRAQLRAMGCQQTPAGLGQHGVSMQ